eukprot:TRINITY_DN2676_c0_g1_i1.p1 TRINITY_DN2676_c0_g1~~TRINITY_DN2676_c0_g1_i1.p1  ORF type:complete len:148 (-),score=33.61 TRINITY_DN2676_c0_g1_i1:54-497(-)
MNGVTKQEAGPTIALLSNLPSYDCKNFSMRKPNAGATLKHKGPVLYTPNIDTDPPSHQVIKTEQGNVLLQSLHTHYLAQQTSLLQDMIWSQEQLSHTTISDETTRRNDIVGANNNNNNTPSSSLKRGFGDIGVFLPFERSARVKIHN